MVTGSDQPNMQPHLAAVLRICECALAGELGLEELHASWPIEARGKPFYDRVFDDVEDGVEHLPGNLFTGRTNERLWRASHEYRVIYLDCLLLRSHRRMEELEKCRESILRRGLGPETVIEENVRDCLDSVSRG